MAARHILPVEPAAAPGVTVVVEVLQHGTQPLDVRLVGCEGESPYVTTLEHRNLGKWRHKFDGTDAEWAAILSCLLLHTPPEKAHVSLLHGVCILHTLQHDQLELSIRRDVGDIKVTLGAICLPKDEEFEFNPFEWAQASATAHAHTRQQLADVTKRVAREQDAIAQLHAQLDNLIQAKHEAETAMLQQFMALLNEKKRKIRDQSRILGGAHVDHDTASSVQTTRAVSRSRKEAAFSSTKRKASAYTTAAPAEAVFGDEPMDVDPATEQDSGEHNDEARASATPDRTDDETDAEARVSTRSSKKAKQAPAVKEKEDYEEEEQGEEEEEEETDDEEL